MKYGVSHQEYRWLLGEVTTDILPDPSRKMAYSEYACVLSIVHCTCMGENTTLVNNDEYHQWCNDDGSGNRDDCRHCHCLCSTGAAIFDIIAGSSNKTSGSSVNAYHSIIKNATVIFFCSAVNVLP